MSCKCANWFLAVVISWLPMGEQIVGTTKTSISLDDSLLMFPTLTSLFHTLLVGWWRHFRRFLSTVTLCQWMVRITGRVRVVWYSSSGSPNQKSLSLSSQLRRSPFYLWLGLGLFAAKLSLATPRVKCLRSRGMLAICGISAVYIGLAISHCFCCWRLHFAQADVMSSRALETTDFRSAISCEVAFPKTNKTSTLFLKALLSRHFVFVLYYVLECVTCIVV